ncbi:MAG: hemin uptake protein HemP [Fuerstiella sp.]
MTDDDSAPPKNPKTDLRPAETPVRFTQLADGKNELTIEHEGQLYRLRATKNGKLLLNK